MIRKASTLAAFLSSALMLTACGTATAQSTFPQQQPHQVQTSPLSNSFESPHSSESSDSLSLITEPRQGMTPFYRAITSAKKSVNLVMYELNDPRVESDLAADAHRGVDVRVLLNSGYYGGGFSFNQPAYNYLNSHGVSVRWTPKYFELTHQKTLVIDGRTAYIMTLNFTPQYYSTSRDFAVVDRQPSDVAAIDATFNDDWTGTRTTAPRGQDLVWSPGSMPAQLNLIDSARSTLDIYNEEMDSPQIESALENAARRGVDVKVVMTNESSWDSAFTQLVRAGVHVCTYAPSASLYIHAKVIIADGHRAFVGSENFSNGSMDLNRELGIIFSTRSLIASLTSTFNTDYSHATPFHTVQFREPIPVRGGYSPTLKAYYNSSYSDWDVNVYNATPNTEAQATDGAYRGSYRTNSSGHADIYLKAPQSAQGTTVTVKVGSETIKGIL